MSDLEVFEWAIRVDDDEPRIIVSLGSDVDDGAPFVWFALDADEAQAMGGALVRASGVLMRRDRAVADPDAFDREPDEEVVAAMVGSRPDDVPVAGGPTL